MSVGAASCPGAVFPLCQSGMTASIPVCLRIRWAGTCKSRRTEPGTGRLLSDFVHSALRGGLGHALLAGVHLSALSSAPPGPLASQVHRLASQRDTRGSAGKRRKQKWEKQQRATQTMDNGARQGRGGGESSLNENRTLRVGAVSSGDWYQCCQRDHYGDIDP